MGDGAAPQSSRAVGFIGKPFAMAEVERALTARSVAGAAL